MNEKSKNISKSLRLLLKENPYFDPNNLRILIALERVLFRLENDKICSNHLTYKGGFVLFKKYESLRFTRDLDALASGISKNSLLKKVKKALLKKYDDGFWLGNIDMEELIEQGNYGSYRFSCAYQIGEPNPQRIHKLSRIHIDINFNDKPFLEPINDECESMIKDEGPIPWKIYPVESIISEKLHAFVEKGSMNSRSKDIYDICFLIDSCQDDKKLSHSIKKTFHDRKREMPLSFLNFAKNLDTNYLRISWQGIIILNKKSSFDKLWEKYLLALERIDNSLINN